MLLLVGDGDRKETYEKLTEALGVTDRVRFLGRVAHEKLPEIYAAADVVALPSHIQESFGMILIEGMASGKPVIASDLPGARAVVDHGEDGFLVRPGDAADLARQLNHLLALDEAKRRAMGHAGRRKVEEQYAWPRIGARLETLYCGVVAGDSRAAKTRAGREAAA
jgi:phosphatidylinositol alpha-mannosyltransferase